ncbi:MAG: hypothetical protein ACLRX4_05450 [Oscillospiraceae bacterium]
MNDYRTEAPPILRDFLSYHETIKAHSRKTVDEYFLDLRNFSVISSRRATRRCAVWS